MIAGGETVPNPADLDAVMADPHNQAAIAFLVDVPSRQGRTVRINVTLPEDLIRDIDRVTTNRSRFLAEAAHRHLATEPV
jgi:hypothetical protein